MKNFFFVFLALSWNKILTVHANSLFGTRIVGGEEARVGQFPFAAAIYVDTSDSRFFCGGALISSQWLITGGQCVYGALSLTIRLGSNSLNGNDPNRLTVATSEVIPHPDFNPQTLEHDIGLAKFRLPISLTDYIQPIALASADLSEQNTPVAIGWGQTSDKRPDLADELNFVVLAVISNNECRFTFGSQITETMVCVEGNYNEGSCKGDSGSPLVLEVNGVMEHVAVATFYSAKGCESFNPSGYTRTYPYVDWIRNTTGIL